jgi:hypothetical protein
MINGKLSADYCIFKPNRKLLRYASSVTALG